MGGPNGLKGQLTTAIDLLTGSFVHPYLIGAGPFTLFLMVDSAFANLTQEEVKVFCYHWLMRTIMVMVIYLYIAHIS